MIWTQIFMQTVFMFLVTMTVLANESDANIRTLWIPLVGTEALVERTNSLETDGRRLYVGTQDGLYISDDDGSTWRPTNLTGAIGIIAISTDAIYATAHGSERGLYRSDDRGETWKPIHSAMPTATSVRVDGSEYERPPYMQQILSTSSSAIIAVAYNDGTYISNDRGETWHDPVEEWMYPGPKAPHVPDYSFSDSIWSMTEFDGYWWAVLSSGSTAVLRTHDNGGTWEYVGGLATLERRWFGQVRDWTVLDGQLYVGCSKGFAQWNEAEQAWEDLSRGLPPPYKFLIHPDHEIQVLAVNRNRIFAGLRENGVWTFDKRSETWTPIGLGGLTVVALVFHQSELFALTREGIFRATISVVQPHGKSAATWGAVKRK